MTSSRPYLIRAFYDWIVDNSLTPHLLVDANFDGVEVPIEHIHEGRIVLNINPVAVDGLSLGNQMVEFKARFGGVEQRVLVPPNAILAIYAKENGQGMAFSGAVAGDDGEGPQPPEPPNSPKKPKPNLKVVK